VNRTWALRVPLDEVGDQRRGGEHLAAEPHGPKLPADHVLLDLLGARPQELGGFPFVEQLRRPDRMLRHHPRLPAAKNGGSSADELEGAAIHGLGST
jgi:hypothetical protein